jgi:hypothetical protein
MQPERAGPSELGRHAPLDDRHIDPDERQLRGKHHAGWSRARDQHLMLGHSAPPSR